MHVAVDYIRALAACSASQASQGGGWISEPAAEQSTAGMSGYTVPSAVHAPRGDTRGDTSSPQAWPW